MTDYKKVIVRPTAFTKVGLLSALSCAMLAACGGGVSSLTSPTGAGIPAALAPASRTHAAQKTQTFSYTGAQQNFTVPAGVRHVTIFAVGASSRSTAGGSVSATIPVQPGEQLAIFVGGRSNGRKGGFNGGGDGGLFPSAPCKPCTTNGVGGGGASDVREGGNALTNRVIVAGGAGGRGGMLDCCEVPRQGLGGRGGIGGGLAGGTGHRGYGRIYEGTYTSGGGGSGGTQQVGGAGGVSGYSWVDGPSGAAGASGLLGIGGAGAISSPHNGGGGGCGGGGGGGYYGGGGGGGASRGGGGGGGGGSSFAEASATAVKIVRGGGASSPSEVVISW